MASRPLRDDSRRTFWPSLGPRAQTTLPQTVSGFSRRVDVARMLALGDARGGSSIHVTTQEPKDPLTSGCRQSGRRPAAVATGNIPTCWHHCGHISSASGAAQTNREARRLVVFGDTWGSQVVISMSDTHSRRSQPPISFSASNRCTELDLCGSSRQRSLGPGGGLQ
jgi:hypothetical protein